MNGRVNAGMIEAIKAWRSDKCLAVSTATQRKHDAEAAKILTRVLNMIEAKPVESGLFEVNVSGEWRKVSMDDALTGAWLGYPVRLNYHEPDER